MNRFLSLVILLHVSCSTFCQIEDYRFWITKTYGGNGYGKISSVNTDGSSYHHGVIFGGALEGSNPKPGFLNGSDGKVYGTMSEGGSFDRGVIFSMNPDGSTYTVLHHFTSVIASPSGQLIEGPNGKLYGICALSDPYISIIFRLDRNTGIFEVIHEFRVNNDGTVPTSLMFASNGMLYGTCQQKGISNNIGTIFRINPVSHTFVKLTDTHGPSPGPLIEGSDGFLYGIAPKGGTMSSGEIHRINLDGSGYTSLFDLNSVGGTSANSYIMEGPDGFLYGTCRVGTGGFLFKIRKNASDFTTLHTFEESNNWAPTSGLMIASDGLLYGYASHVYSSQKYLYRINPNGAGFEQLNAAPYTLDQSAPVEAEEGSFLFASVSDGEARNGRIMKVIPGGTSLIIKEFAEIENQPYKILHSRSNEIYGINKNGGAEGYGGVFKLTKDGTHLLTTIFKNSATNHELLTFHLAEDGDGNFYAYTLGADNVSAISKLSPNGSRSTIYQFLDNSNTSYNTGEPILGSDGRIYGMTLRGGIHGKGTIFSLRTDGSEFTTRHSFTENTIPRQPFQFESGGYLYGIVNGGANNTGSIFRFHMSTNVFETIFDFPSDIGVLLFGNVKLLKGSDNMMYVSAASGGTTAGIIFKLAMDGSGFQEVHTFLREDDKGWIPMRLLEGPDSKLYGIAAYGGTHNTGVVFSMNRDGSDYQTVFQLPEELGLRLASEVDLTLIPKIPQQITFSLPSHTAQVGDVPITLNATSDAGFPVAFFSSDPTIAKIEGSTLKILKAGEVTISAKQVTNDFYTQGTVAHVLSIAKGNQVLTFNTISPKTVGGSQFELTATSSAGLPVSYSTTDDNISLSGNKVTAISAGMATIKAEQAGDANYNAAPTVEQSFCINPSKPAITQERISATEILLTSSNDAGNQWYFNEAEIALATAKTLTATEEGTYTVKTTVETCASELSDEFSTTITGIEVSPEDRLAIYPNPARRDLVVEQKKAPSTFVIISIIDSSGKVLLQRTSKNTHEVFDVGSFGSGLYQIQVQADGKFFGRRFVKN